MNNDLDNVFLKENDTIDLKAELEKYLAHWKWFLLSAVVCLSLAVLYAKTKVNIFSTNTTILVKEKGGIASELQVFQDLSSLGMSSNNNVLDEIEILNSRTIAEDYVKKLNLNAEVYQKIGLKNIEQFSKNPLLYKVLSDQENFYELDTLININFIDQNSFSYQIQASDEAITAKFGEKITIGGTYDVLLLPSKSYHRDDYNTSCQLKFSSLENTIEKYKKNLTVSSIDDGSNIISINLRHPVKPKAQMVLNTMVDLYNQKSIEDKNQVGVKTAAFITKRLEAIKVELDAIDGLEEVYKTNQQITDIFEQSKVFVEGRTENKQASFQKNTELSLVNFMIEDIQNQKENFELLPANIGIASNPQLSMMVAKFNELLLERNSLLRSSSLSNPIVQNLNVELLSLRANIATSLKNIKKQLEIALASFDAKEKEFESKIASLPKQAREYRTILRRQSIIANLYSYLLQKKEENEISMAVTTPNSKVIDRAYSDKSPVAPKKPIIALVGLIVGLLIPFVVIYLTDLLSTSFSARKDMEDAVSAPILGDIPPDKSQEKVIMKQGSRSGSAEAFRLLRTNLDFMLTEVTSACKTIFVTSTISGEGKTFITVNTAASIALTGKKVLLLGMDLRAPKITQYLGLPNKKGITNYLIKSEATKLSDIIFSLDGYENLDVLSSGIVPPNPAELLLNPKIATMFEELKATYDYILVDTAPVNLVTDTLMLSKYADMFIYVSRIDYLDKRMFVVPQQLYKEKRLPNMAMLINGLDHSRAYGYGNYGYAGYGYGDNQPVQKNIFQRIFKK